MLKVTKMSKIDDRIVFEPTGFDYVNPKAEVVIESNIIHMKMC